MQRKLKKQVIYVLYGLAFCFMIVGLILMENSFKKNDYSKNDDYDYVTSSVIDEENIPVVATSNIIIRPYNDQSVKILKNYYDLNADEETQQNSLIFYENTYMPSSGISYGGDNQFDVFSILDGKVIEVKEDDTLGNVITIEHEKGIISIYQSITDIVVKKDDEVKQGSVIAKSSQSNISPDLGNHLYFELVISGKNVNPENYYDKSLDEL